MTQDTCIITDCDRPRYQQRRMCSTHTMRKHRYGDPHHQPAPHYVDLSGQRFGLLLVERRDGRHWICRCDCGATASIPTGNLNRGQTTCGNASTHRRQEAVGYWGVHQRIEADRGKAAAHPCADCGAPAAHWSYNNAGTDEHRDPRSGLAYSLDQSDYTPRCAPCHGAFDSRTQPDTRKAS